MISNVSAVPGRHPAAGSGTGWASAGAPGAGKIIKSSKAGKPSKTEVKAPTAEIRELRKSYRAQKRMGDVQASKKMN